MRFTVYSIRTLSRSNWNLEMLISEESEKAENLGKTFRSKDESQQQTQLTYDAESGNRTRATLVGSECSHHWAIPGSSNDDTEYFIPWIVVGVICDLNWSSKSLTVPAQRKSYCIVMGWEKISFSDCDQACSFHLFRHTEWGPRSNSTTSVPILQRWRSIGNLPPSSTPSPWVGDGNRQSSIWWGPAPRSRTLPVCSQFVTREFSSSAFVNFRHNSPSAEATKGSCLQVW